MAYITYSDLIDENLPVSYDETLVESRIQFAQQLIEKVTQKFFEPVSTVLSFDGNGDDDLDLPMPLISFSKVEFRSGPGNFLDVPVSNFHNYNSFFNQDSPRIAIIEFSSLAAVDFGMDASCFPMGNGNIRITGEWGYLDRSGNTPSDIIMATKLLTMDFINNVGDLSMREDLERRNLAEEEVDGHRWESHEKISGGKFTGNKEVDQILARYRPSGDCNMVMPRNSRQKNDLYSW